MQCGFNFSFYVAARDSQKENLMTWHLQDGDATSLIAYLMYRFTFFFRPCVEFQETQEYFRDHWSTDFRARHADDDAMCLAMIAGITSRGSLTMMRCVRP